MVDWREVERLRSKGWDWNAIAEDPKVSFTAPSGSGDAGRALKTLYHTRKSQRSRTSRGQAVDAEDDFPAARGTVLGSRLLIIGLFLVAMAGIWSIVALSYPSPFGVLVPFVPDLGIGLILGGVLLAIGLVLGVADFRSIAWKAATVGIVIGVVGVGLSGWVATNQGFLNLKPETSYGNGWGYADNAAWKGDNGKPIVFWYASAACPYCSASSWALEVALEQFGQLSGTYTTTSSPTDVYPNTPEVAFSTSSLTSNFLSWDPKEDPNNQVINNPPLTPDEQSYVTAYGIPAGESSAPIPFAVFGGFYMHSGGFVSPPDLCSTGCSSTSAGDPNYLAYSPAQVQAFLSSGSGPVYTAIMTQAYIFEAYFWMVDKLTDVAPPASVTSNPSVQADFDVIPTP
jgi:ABC-type transport system involved in multi-copper enzyme maturation permease subunit